MKIYDVLSPSAYTTSRVGGIDGFNVTGLWEFDTADARDLYVKNDESDVVLTFDVVNTHRTGTLLVALTLENEESAVRSVQLPTVVDSAKVQRVSLAVDGVMRAMMSPLHTVRLSWYSPEDTVRISDMRLEQSPQASMLPEVETITVG